MPGGFRLPVKACRSPPIAQVPGFYLLRFKDFVSIHAHGMVNSKSRSQRTRRWRICPFPCAMTILIIDKKPVFLKRNFTKHRASGRRTRIFEPSTLRAIRRLGVDIWPLVYPCGSRRTATWFWSFGPKTQKAGAADVSPRKLIWGAGHRGIGLQNALTDVGRLRGIGPLVQRPKGA